MMLRGRFDNPSSRTKALPAALVFVLIFFAAYFQIAMSVPALASSGPSVVASGLTPGYPVALNDQQKLFFDVNTGAWWAFYSDGASMQCTTSNDGASWSQPVSINGSVTAGSKLSVWFDSLTNTLYYVAASGGFTFHYRYGVIGSLGCGSIAWSINDTMVYGAHGNTNSPTISSINSTAAWISITENINTNYYVESFLCNVTSCISKLILTLPNLETDSEILNMGAGRGPPAAGLLYASITSSGGGPINFAYTTDGGSDWNSSAFSTTNSYSGNRMSAAAIGATIYIAAIEDNLTIPNNILFFKYTLGGAPPSESIVVPAGGGIRNVDIVADNQTGIVVGYTDTSNVYYTNSSNFGSSWGQPKPLFTGETVIYQSVLNLARGSNNNFGMLWSEGSSTRNVMFGEFELPNASISTAGNSTGVTDTSQNSCPTCTSSSTSTSTSTGVISSQTSQQRPPPGSEVGLVYLLLALDILSAVVAFPISFYSFRFNRFLGSSALKAISVGFAILGTGLLVEGLTTFIADATVVDGLLGQKLVADAGILFLGLQLAAYVSLAWGYGMEVYSKGRAEGRGLANPESLLPVGILASTFGAYYDTALLVYLLMVALLAFIVFEAVLVYGRSRRRPALIVLLAFGLIFAGHVMMLDSVASLTPVTFDGGTVAQFVGFVMLLWFLVRSGRPSAT